MKIVLSAVLAMFLIGCSEDKATTQTQAVNEVKTIVEKKVELTTPKVAEQVVETKSETAAPVVEKTIVAVSSGELIYKKCSTCHGPKAEKKALDKSQIIQGWKASKVVAAINGYKDGSYGSSMKGAMVPQVKNLSESEINAVSKYISGL